MTSSHILINEVQSLMSGFAQYFVLSVSQSQVARPFCCTKHACNRDLALRVQPLFAFHSVQSM
jgi:hypothetical protein